MDELKVTWSDSAKDDLRYIVKYITEVGHAPEAATKLAGRITKTADMLAYLPYRIFFDKKRGIRKCNVESYLILYKVHENAEPKFVEITQVIHGRRNLRRCVR